jgi:hypothetical protein
MSLHAPGAGGRDFAVGLASGGAARGRAGARHALPTLAWRTRRRSTSPGASRARCALLSTEPRKCTRVCSPCEWYGSERPVSRGWYTNQDDSSRDRVRFLRWPLAGVITILSFLAVVTWVGWRFGPTLTRVTGWCSWCVAWACGSQGGYGYFVAFLLLGTLAWAGGTIWYAKRRGRWPSALAARLFGRLLDKGTPVAHVEPLAVVVAPRHHR